MNRKKVDPKDIYYDEEHDTCFEFPCEFPIKAMGRTGNELETAVLEIINRHVEDLTEDAVKFNQSSNGKFTSITKLYVELTACDHVLYCL